MKTKKENEENEAENSIWHHIGMILSIALCILLLPLLAVNMVLSVKSYTGSERIPSIGSFFPLIVMNDSMYPKIESRDLVICRQEKPENIAVGDIIAFIDPEDDTSLVIHQVDSILTENGTLKFQTKGIANNILDDMPVPAENIEGIYCRRIAGAGKIAMLFQSTNGLVICVILPLVFLLGYEMYRWHLLEKRKIQEEENLLARLENMYIKKK